MVVRVWFHDASETLENETVRNWPTEQLQPAKTTGWANKDARELRSLGLREGAATSKTRAQRSTPQIASRSSAPFGPADSEGRRKLPKRQTFPSLSLLFEPEGASCALPCPTHPVMKSPNYYLRSVPLLAPLSFTISHKQFKIFRKTQESAAKESTRRNFSVAKIMKQRKRE